MSEYVKNIIEAVVLCLIFWGILLFSMHKDRSRYRNVIFLFLAASFSLNLIAAIFEIFANVFSAVLLIAGALLILVLPIFLIINGIVMIRKEGKRFKNLLSLILGILIMLGEFFGALIVVLPSINDNGLLKFFDGLPLFFVFFITVIFYGSFSLVIFAVYSLFLQILPVRKDFDYVIIHGAGLLHGDKVSKLLADRLDKAIEVYKKDPTPPYLIPSGGQGGDETVPEAIAMKGYLIEHGIPEDKILVEDKSKTTYENVKNSIDLISQHGGQNSYVALVTSNYHVYRALRYCRKLALKCTGIGAHVAAYYWPSAVIREFVAIHKEKKHMILFTIGLLICLIPFFLLLMERFS